MHILGLIGLLLRFSEGIDIVGIWFFDLVGIWNFCLIGRFVTWGYFAFHLRKIQKVLSLHTWFLWHWCILNLEWYSWHHHWGLWAHLLSSLAVDRFLLWWHFCWASVISDWMYLVWAVMQLLMETICWKPPLTPTHPPPTYISMGLWQSCGIGTL